MKDETGSRRRRRLRPVIGSASVWAALCLGGIGFTAPKKGVSLDDLVPAKKPVVRPAPRKPTPRTSVKKATPAPVAVKRPMTKPVVVKAPGETLTVGEGAPFKTITEALLKAPAGARVRVRAGTYRESLTLTKTVEIVPASLEAVVTVEGGVQPAVTLKTGRAVLRRLTLREGPGVGQAAYAVDVPQGELLLDDCSVSSGAAACVGVHGATAGVSLQKCRLQGEKIGLEVTEGGQATVEGGSLSNNGASGARVAGAGKLTMHGCRVADNGAVGLLFQGGALGTVEDSDLTLNRDLGALIEGGAGPSFKDVRVVRNAREGIAARQGGKPTLLGCDLLENGGAGLYLTNRDTLVTAKGCRFRANKGNGIDVADLASGQIEDADVAGNGYFGIAVGGAGELTVKRSRVVGTAKDAIIFLGKSRGLFEDCDLSKSPGAAVLAIHESSQPTFRRCKIHVSGVYVSGKAEPRLEDCDVFDTEGAAINLLESRARIVNCRVYRSKGEGIVCLRGAQPSLEGCDLYANKNANLLVVEGADPTVTKCIFRDGGGPGVAVVTGGRGTFTDCEFRGNTYHGVGTESGGAPLFRNCRFLNGKTHGVFIQADGGGTFEDCTISGNTHDGAHSIRNGNALFRRCRIVGNIKFGLIATEGGRARAEACEITGNPSGNVVFRDGSKITLQDCRTQ